MAKLGTEIIMALEDSSKPITATQVLDYCPAAPSIKAVKANLKYRVKTGQVEEILEPGFSPRYKLIKTESENEPVVDPDDKSGQKKGIKDLVDDAASLGLDIRPTAEYPTPDPDLKLKDFTGSEELATITDLTPGQSQLQAQHDYLRRSLDHSQRLLDDYLESVTDPLILKSLEGMRDLAIIQLEQLVEPAEEENGTSGIIRNGTG